MKAETQENNRVIKTSKNEHLYVMVKDEDGKIFIATGKWKVSEKKFNTYKEAEEYIASKPYELIYNTILVFQQLQKEKDERQNKENS